MKRVSLIGYLIRINYFVVFISTHDEALNRHLKCKDRTKEGFLQSSLDDAKSTTVRC